MAEKRPFCNYSGRTKELQTGDTLPGGASFASAAEDLAGAEAAKAIAPLTNLQLIKNLKLTVNASVNKLDVFTKSGGAVPDATNIIVVAIPDGTGYTFRGRSATYLSGTSQFVLADATNYWSKGSLNAEIKNAYVYAIWDANGGIVWALGGYSGFTRVPASTTATDDDFFLLEASSTYTKVITDYCVCVGKIRYEYDTADTPDHTIQATVLDSPQVVWNPKSDYGRNVALVTSITSGSAIPEDSYVNTVVKQTGKYFISAKLLGRGLGGQITGHIKTGSATYSSAVTKMGYLIQFCDTYNDMSASAGILVYLNVGDTIHLGISMNASSGNRNIWGEDGGYVNGTGFVFTRVD
jgi:hypothetical protein